MREEMNIAKKIFFLLAAWTPPAFLFFVLPFSNVNYIMMGLVLLFGIVIWIYYMVHAGKNQKLKKPEKIAWVLFIFFVAVVGQTLYWFFYIWPEPTSEPA